MTQPLSAALLEILGPEHNWVTTLTFLGHVTSSVTWPLDFPCPISYSSSIVTKSLSPALFEILCPKDNWVTTLTFLGHVTSSIMWPIDSPYAICYWLFIDTVALALNVFEIFDPKVPCAHTHTHTLQVILYSVPCNALHWTDNYVLYACEILRQKTNACLNFPHLSMTMTVSSSLHIIISRLFSGR